MTTWRAAEKGGGDLDRLAGAIREHEEEARKSARLAVGHKIAIGKLLIEAKGNLPRGEFGAWAQDQFGWHRNHVARHMQLARHATRVLQSVGAEASLRMGLAVLRGGSAAVVGVDGGGRLWRLVGEAEWSGEGVPSIDQMMGAVKTWRVQRVAA